MKNKLIISRIALGAALLGAIPTAQAWTWGSVTNFFKNRPKATLFSVVAVAGGFLWGRKVWCWDKKQDIAQQKQDPLPESYVSLWKTFELLKQWEKEFKDYTLKKLSAARKEDWKGVQEKINKLKAMSIPLKPLLDGEVLIPIFKNPEELTLSERSFCSRSKRACKQIDSLDDDLKGVLRTLHLYSLN